MNTSHEEMGEDLEDDLRLQEAVGVCHRNMIDAAVRILLPRL